MAKKFKLGPDQIKPLATGRGACLATDRITVQGKLINFMYREKQLDHEQDSGWRFMAGDEGQDYMDDPDNLSIYDVNTIANYDPSIIPHLDAPPGAVFERAPGSKNFRPVEDWEPPED